MLSKNFRNQTIALAGVSQSVALVQQIATTGTADEVALKTSINSLLNLNAKTMSDIFGSDKKNLELGLTTFQKQITGYQINNPDQGRYAASLVYLEREFSRNADMKRQVQQEVGKAQAQLEHFDLLHENVLAKLGDLYHETISTIQPRIMVNGEQQYLSRPDTVNKIRALLLAGIRSALLWRQCGGARWKFLFYRKKLQDEVAQLLSEV